MRTRPATTNQFYTLAKQYFVAAGSTVVDAPANGQTLEGVFNELKHENDVADNHQHRESRRRIRRDRSARSRSPTRPPAAS